MFYIPNRNGFFLISLFLLNKIIADYKIFVNIFFCVYKNSYNLLFSVFTKISCLTHVQRTLNIDVKIILKKGHKMSKKQPIKKQIIKIGNSTGITISGEILGNNFVAPADYLLDIKVNRNGVVSFQLPVKKWFL